MQISSEKNPAYSKFRVAIVNPPYFDRFSRSQRSPGVIKSGTMYYPYWLAHAAAVLERRGFEILLMDCPAANLSRETLFDRLAEYQPSLILMDTSTASADNDFQLAAEIKKRISDVEVCMVGTHATALWQETLTNYPGVDYVAIGEYDYTVCFLAEVIAAGAHSGSGRDMKLGTIPALGFRLSSGGTARGPVQSPIENVDELPWIAPIYKRFLDVKNYQFSLASYPMVMLIGGRGCVAKCTYCVYPQVMHGHSYRTRSPESVVGEMKWIQDNMPEVQEIVFEDDTFTGDREYAKRVAELVREKGVRLAWFANVRANTDKETLTHMKKAGFRCCAVGFESGDDLLLKNMWKGTTLETQKRFVKDAQDLGILVHGCFMMGFPGESQETMEKTLQLAIDLSPDSAQFYPVMPFPGTTYYKWAKENGYLATDNFSDWLNEEGGHRCVLNLPGLRAEDIERFCEKAYKRFHFRPKYMLFKLGQAFRKPIEGARSIRAFLFYIAYLLTNQRKKLTRPFSVRSIPVPGDWYRTHQQPRGRMFEQTVQLRDAAKQSVSADSMAALAKKFPDL